MTPEQRLTRRQIGDAIATIMSRYADGDWEWLQKFDELEDLRILARNMHELDGRDG